MSFYWCKTNRSLITLNQVQMDLTPECHTMKASCFHHWVCMHQFHQLCVGKGKVSNKSFLHPLIFPSFVSFVFVVNQPIKVSNSLQNKKPLHQCVSVDLYVTCNLTFTEQSCSTLFSQLWRSTASSQVCIKSCFCSAEQNVRIFRISVIYILQYQFISNLN